VPLIPNHQFKAGFNYLITPIWTFGMNMQAFSSSYFRGDESNINRKLPPYFTANLNTSVQVTENVQVFALVTNLFNNRYANFGTFAETGAVAGGFRINDPRTTTLVQPLSAYGGIRVTW
jgi:outer membrane receptor protein involved in Fe transport